MSRILIPYGLTVAAAVLLVASLFLGGKGASSMADKLAKGTWKGERTGAFNWQAILALAGTVALLVATAVGTSSHRTTTTTKDPCVALLSRELAMPHPDLKQLRNELTLCEAVRFVALQWTVTGYHERGPADLESVLAM